MYSTALADWAKFVCGEFPNMSFTNLSFVNMINVKIGLLVLNGNT